MGVSGVSGVSPQSQDCLNCPNPRLVGPAPASGKCEDFAIFFGAATQRQKNDEEQRAFFVEFFRHPAGWAWSTQPAGLDPVPPNSVFDTGSPNSVSILVRPTGPEIRF